MDMRRHTIRLLVPEVATHGGIQRYMLSLLEMLRELPDAHVECFSLNDNDQPLADRVHALTENTRGFGRDKLAFSLSQLLTPRSDTTLLVGHLHLAPVALAARLFGRIKDYIVVLHGIEAWQRHGWLTRWALRQARALVATTHYTVRQSADMDGVALERYVVIPLCTAREPAPPTPGFRLPGAFPLLMVARLDPSERYKGMEMVIDAVAELLRANVPVHFNLVGDGADRARLEGYASDKGVAQHVTFWGTLNDADLQAAYESTALFVMPSKKEGFGIVFIEAMRHGIPCIGGNHGGTPEVILDGETGYLVDYGDTKGLVERISALWRDPGLRDRMASASTRVHGEQFTYEIFSARWRKLISRC